MGLAVAATFGSLPEAQIAFSALQAAGLNPVPAYNMNTPGGAGGMAPSAYRVVVPEEQVAAAREVLAELRKAAAEERHNQDSEDAEGVADSNAIPPTTLGRFRLVARGLIAVALITFFLVRCLGLFGR